MNSLETHVLELIGEDTTSPDVFLDTSSGIAQIRDSLNDAIEDIAIVTGGQKRMYHLPLEGGCTFYRLRWTMDHFAWFTDAWLVGQKRRLEQTDLVKLFAYNPRWMLNSGSPQSYIPVGKNIVGFWPRPSGDTDVVAFNCVVIPDRYTTDTDRIKLRDNYKWAAVHYAVSEYWASRGDAKTAEYHLGKFLEKAGILTEFPMYADANNTLKTNKEPWPKSTG